MDIPTGVLGGLGAMPLFLIGVAVVVGVAVLGWYRTSKRRAALAAWAATSGWSYVGSDDALAWSLSRDPFGRGDRIEGQDVLRGAWHGAPACSLTYASTDISRDSEGRTQQSTTYHHVVMLDLPAALPFVELTPDGVGAKLMKAFGGTDLNFESEAFNRTYRVDATDPVVAHAVIHPRLMERLLEPDVRGTAWRIEGTRIVTWRSGPSDVERIMPALTLLSTIVESVPRHVWLDHGYDPAASR